MFDSLKFNLNQILKNAGKNIFHYAKDGRIKRKTEHHFDYISPEPYLIREFYSFDNGLVKSVISKHRVNTEKEEIRFVYQFRKE